MSDSQSYAAIVSHDVDISPIYRPSLVAGSHVQQSCRTWKSKREKCYNVPLLFTQFQNSCISAILRVTSIKNRAVSEYNMDLEPYYLKS